MKSPLAGLVSDHFGVDKRPPVDTAPFEHLFHEEQLPVLSNQQDVYNILREMPLILENTGFLDGIDANAIQAMSASGMIVKVRAVDVIVEAGKIENEITIILEGDCELYSGNKSISHLGPGDIFGEVAFFRGDGERTASVRALSNARLLILKKNFLDSLWEKHPDAVYTILFRPGSVLAERVSDTTTQLRQASSAD